MSNSPLTDLTQLSPNCTSPRRGKIDTITIHCVVGQWSVETLGGFFEKPSTRSSCNYAVGTDGRILLCVDEGDRSWCSSNGDNDHRAITIEVASDTTHPYAVNDAAMRGLIALCTDICKRNGIPKLLWQGDKSLIGQVEKQNMTVHRWFANKACPGDYLYNLHGYIADEVNKGLLPEEKEEKQEKQEVTLEQFERLWAQMRDKWQTGDGQTWSQEARDWAVKQGLVQGDEDAKPMWQDLLTREQLVTILYRFAQTLS